MKVIFTGDPIELERGEGLSRLSTQLFGKTFPMSAEVDVSDLSETQKRKLLNNPHFRAVGVDALPVALVLPASVTAASEPAVIDDDADEQVAAAAHAERAAAKKTKAK